MSFCLVLNLTTTCTDGKWAIIWPPMFATRYVSFATNLKFISNTVCMCELVPLNVNSGAQPTASLRSIRDVIRTVTDIEMVAVRKFLRCSATHSGQKPLPVLFLFPIAY